MKGYAGKILMVVQNHFPADPRVRNEAYALSSAGYEVSVLALRKKGEKRRENVNGIAVYRMPAVDLFKKGYGDTASFVGRVVHRLKSVIGYGVEYFYFTFASLFLSFCILKREGFDVVHAHNPPDTLFLLGVLYKLWGKKFVFDHHDLSPELYLSRFGANRRIVYKILMAAERMSLHVADLVIATNESYRAIEIDRGNVNPRRVFVVRNGPDLERVRRVPPDEKLKANGKKILGYVGVMGPQDGVDYLLRALRILVYDLGRKDFLCIIVGNGDCLEDLKALSRQLKIEPYVRFTGYVTDEEMLRYLSTSDICVDPDPSSPLNDVSTWIKIMEYMALGKPIVSFDLKETRYTAGDAATYVAPNDEREFARAIMRLMDDPRAREEMGAFGERKIIEKLGWHHISKDLVLAYESMLKGFQ
jgi:glycosyltransferase involved in cell wall biosynthesis